MSRLTWAGPLVECLHRGQSQPRWLNSNYGLPLAWGSGGRIRGGRPKGFPATPASRGQTPNDLRRKIPAPNTDGRPWSRNRKNGQPGSLLEVPQTTTKSGYHIPSSSPFLPAGGLFHQAKIPEVRPDAIELPPPDKAGQYSRCWAESPAQSGQCETMKKIRKYEAEAAFGCE